MKKDISIAVMATILILQLIGNTVGGFIGDVADKAAEMLSSRIQIEQFIQSGE
jgi:protein involved in sex pheromone biosynthesis